MSETTFPVVDATSPMVVTISEDDREAVQCSPTNCVIANAISRQRGVFDQRVGAASVRILRGGKWHRYDIDKTTASMIRAYDLDGQVMPAGVKIRLVPPRRPVGTRRGEAHGSNKRSGAKRSVATRRPSSRFIFIEPAATVPS